MQPEQRINHGKLRSRLDKIIRRYNPESDYNPDIPVTCNEIALTMVFKDLLDEIEFIRKQQDALTELFYNHTREV